MPSSVQSRPHFLSPFPRGKVPAAFRGRAVLPLSVEICNSPKLLRRDETLALYRAWKNGELGLNPSAAMAALLEVKIEHAGESCFYQYPIDVNYLFSQEWRRDNLTSPFGFFRWMAEIDTALRLNSVAGFENRRLTQSAVTTAFGCTKKLEGSSCKYKMINLSLADILVLNTFLVHFDRTGLLDSFSGNHRQAALARAAGISNLGQLFSALSHLENREGKRWAKVLGYNHICLPAAKVEKLLRELKGENWEKYRGNDRQIALANAVGISNLSHLFSALSHLENREGQTWVKVLEYNLIGLPAAKAEKLLRELAGDKWRKYRGNHKQAVLAKAAGIANLGQLFSALSNLKDGAGKPWSEVLAYNRINLPAAKAEKLLQLLTEDSWEQYKGNDKQIALAKAADITHLIQLYSALSNLKNEEGKSWVEVLGHNQIDLPVASAEKLLQDLEGDKWKQYQGNDRQIALAKAAGISHLNQLFSALTNLKNGEGRSWAKVLEYNHISLPVASVEKLLEELGGEKWKQYLGNDKQIALARAAGIVNLNQLYSALSNLRNDEGKIWAEVLGYNQINLPVASVEKLLRELAGEKWKQYRGNDRQVALAKAAGISHLSQLYSALAHLKNEAEKFWIEVLGHNKIDLPVVSVEKLLQTLEGEKWKQYQGNDKQIALAKAAGISYLGHLFSALNNLKNSAGKSWAEALEYNEIDLPVAKAESFLGEFFGFVKKYNLPLRPFVRAFHGLKAQACRPRFNQIRDNFFLVKKAIDERRRADWPENFYKYLLRILPLLPSAEDPQKAAQDILGYIEREEAKIYQTLKDIPPDKVSYGELQRQFGRYAIPVIKFHGAGLAAVKRIQREKTREVYLLDLPFFQMMGVDAVVDTLSLNPLEALLLKEELEKSNLVQKAMRRLPAAEAKIIEMLHFQGKSIANVMHALGIDSETVNKRFEAALDHLRELMEEEF